MANTRVKGQEAYVVIMRDGDPQITIDSVSSLEVEFMMEILEEGYLGETSNRFDSIYNGMRVKIEGHCNSEAYLELAQAIKEKAQYRAGSTVRIDVVASYAFQNGDFPSLVLQDVHFDAIPFSIDSRQSFQSFSLEGKCSEFTKISP